MIFLGTNAVFLGVAAIFSNHDEDDAVGQWTVTIMCLLAKMNSAASFCVVYIHTVEIFPTGIRNVGMGFTWFVCDIIGLTGPHFVSLGRVNKAIPYIGLSLLSVCSSVAASFLPETLGASLPETVTEAAEYGKDQKYFQLKVVQNVQVKDDKI